MPADKAPNDWTGFYVPEVHDVHPGMAEVLGDLVDLFAPAARAQIAFSIVPNWQGRFALDADAAFAARVRALPGTKVLHGWTHSLGPDALNWLLYGHDNRSEFRALDRAETDRRLDLGQGMLARVLGTAPVWFCAPRWQQNRHLAPALAARGFRGSLGHGAIFRTGAAPVPLPALNFDEGERTVKIALGLAARRLWIARQVRLRRPFRLALHPADVTRRGTLAQIRALMRRLADEGWVPLSLEQALYRWRAA